MKTQKCAVDHALGDSDSEIDCCREAIIKSAMAVMEISGLDYFTIPEVLEFMANHNSRYAESTK